jgi:sodium-coupled neutral amino acid transporter 11
MGIMGYLGFLDETQGDILNNFDPDTVQASAARILLAITMFFTYP